MPVRVIGRRTARCKWWEDRRTPLEFRSFGREAGRPSPPFRTASMKLLLKRTAMSMLRLSEPLHEPTHPRPLPGGEQASVRVLSVPLLGGVRGGFMVPVHAQERKEAFHEPTHPQPLPGGEQASVRVLSVPLLGGARGGFVVPMHAQKR